ncbi:MAG: hypothetical protein CMJ81_21435 [Planctomycetaceae bacterium]|nr:hypothetical protein [Planctomycetaceae bacterium]MBP63364.1 hypothetical protein [Planctomycetaceae bacterium]
MSMATKLPRGVRPDSPSHSAGILAKGRRRSDRETDGPQLPGRASSHRILTEILIIFSSGFRAGQASQEASAANMEHNGRRPHHAESVTSTAPVNRRFDRLDVYGEWRICMACRNGRAARVIGTLLQLILPDIFRLP